MRKRGTAPGRSSRAPTTSSPSSKRASGATRSGIGPMYVYGSQFATSAKAARPSPFTSTRWAEADALLGEVADQRPGKPQVAGPLAVLVAPERVHPAHQLGVEPDAGGEPEAAAVHPSERDPPGAALEQRVHELLGRLGGLRRDPERPREHARAAARDEPDRVDAVEAVEHLVVAAVAGEDEQNVGLLARLRARARSRDPPARSTPSERGPPARASARRRARAPR